MRWSPAAVLALERPSPPRLHRIDMFFHEALETCAQPLNQSGKFKIHAWRSSVSPLFFAADSLTIYS
jgi:hypothetical protein